MIWIIIINVFMMIRMINIEILSNKDNVLEIIIKNEGYTLLNLLVDELNRDPDVKYATYTMIHPLENKIKMIVMTSDGVSPLEAIKKAVSNLDRKISKLREEIRKIT